MNFILTSLWIILASIFGYYLGHLVNLPDNMTPLLCALGCGVLALLFRFFPAIVIEALT